MEKINERRPAFPHVGLQNVGAENRFCFDGMSLREWFAGMALANPQVMTLSGFDDGDCQMVARRAFNVADAMIKESLNGKRD